MAEPTYVNLTPHPIHVYHPATPDRIDQDGEHAPLLVLWTSGAIARLAGAERRETVLPHDGRALPVSDIDYGDATGLPEFAEGTYYVVSLVVSLAARGRLDLLSPYREVRNMSGQVIGCRAFARCA